MIAYRVQTESLPLALTSQMCFVSVFMNYFDNPGGMIPAWLVNWAAKVSVTGLHTTSESWKHSQLYTHDGSGLTEQDGSHAENYLRWNQRSVAWSAEPFRCFLLLFGSR